MSKRAIQPSTIRPHSQGLEELRQSHTSRASSEIFAPEFTHPEPATLANPTITSKNTSHNAKGMRSADHDTTDTNDVRIAAQVAKRGEELSGEVDAENVGRSMHFHSGKNFMSAKCLMI